MKINTATLSNGVKIPMFGFGTFLAKDDELEKALEVALDAGYTSFDTAMIYENENIVGKVLNNCGKKREELFVTTKLWNADHGYDNALRAIDKSLKTLNMDYVDLYLIHWPGKDKYVETWKAMERIYEQKLVRAIGVSNFMEKHLDDVISNCTVTPMVNQVELHPKWMQPELVSYCRSKGMLLEAWMPIGRSSGLLGEKVLVDVSAETGKTPAQVTLRYLLQKGIRSFPKSVHEARIRENIDIFDFELNEAQMAAIDAMETTERIGPSPEDFFPLTV